MVTLGDWMEASLPRDEMAARCGACKVPCAVTSQYGMCGMCEEQRKCKCPPVATQYASTGPRCWQCGGRR
jgi:hypothetical protein